MKFLSAIFRATSDATPYSDGNDFWYNPLPGYRTASGARVGPETSLQVSAVFAARRLISETLAKVPLLTYERQDETSKTRAVSHPLYRLLNYRPNNYQTSYEWRVQAQDHVLGHGNHYSQKIFAPDGQVAQLIPLRPNQMQVKKLPNFRVGYLYRGQDGLQVPLTMDEVCHVRGPILSSYRGDANGSDPDLIGVSPVTYARETIGSSMVQEQYAAALFKNGAMHKGTLTVPGTLNKDQRQAIRDQIKQEHAGASGWHSTMVLESGAKWETVTMTAADAEFLMERKFNVIEIARWFNIQPHLLRDLEKSSYSNHEQESLEFAQVTMLPHFVNWEQVISRDLIIDDNIFAEFLLDAVTRADIAARYTAYGTAIDKGFMTPNEARSRENLNALDGLDRPRMAVNISMLDENGDVIPNPNAQNKQLGGQNDQAGQGQGARNAYYEKLLCATADQMNGVEIKALKGIFAKQQAPAKRKDEGLDFYDRFAVKLSKYLCVSHETAQAFAMNQAKRFLNAVETGAEQEIIDDLTENGQERLLAFIMREGLAQENAEARAA